MKTNVSAAVGFCLVLVLSLVSEPLVKDAAAQTKTLKIGLITSMTGPIAPAVSVMTDALKPVEELMDKRRNYGQRSEIKRECSQETPFDAPRRYPARKSSIVSQTLVGGVGGNPFLAVEGALSPASACPCREITLPLV